ncbi:hypothetical protein A6411_09280 [Prescottella equi]|uniref:hypothetical protein n=1 Tax=Rhodococcus hoagii TaxID=43767 RepID=UPI0009BE38B2|nr:hypothetical protein [Prescottella equi]OQQ32017.1 hypothetical protein A6411_09280 [Prescottella equi]
MPLTREHTERYADALVAMATATQRPANIVNLGGTYAIRVEFELGRYLLATNADGDLATTADGGPGTWTVKFFGSADVPLASADREWLVDAFDAVVGELRASKWWREDGTTYGEFAPSTC